MPMLIANEVHSWRRGDSSVYCGLSMRDAVHSKRPVTCRVCVDIGRRRFARDWGEWNAAHSEEVEKRD